MASNSDKGIYILAIYIRKHSDIDHPLSVGDIAKGIKPYCGDITMDSVRRTVIRHLDELLSYDGEHITVCKENGELYYPGDDSPGKRCRIWYEQDFSEVDIHMMSDAIIYSRHLKEMESKRLLRKITALRYPTEYNFWAKNAIKDAEELSLDTTDLYRNLEWINHAIAEQKCIDFELNVYDCKKKLKPRSKIKGFSPYKIYMKNHTYYVLGVIDKDRKFRDDFLLKHPQSKAQYNICRFELYRISKLRNNEECQYLQIDKTILSKKGLREIIDGSYSIYNEWIGKGWGIEQVVLLANDRGIHVLVATFGRKSKIIELKEKEYEKYSHRNRTVEEIVYKVEFNFLNLEEWLLLLNLLLRYPTRDIEYVSPQKELKRMTERLVLHLK